MSLNSRLTHFISQDSSTQPTIPPQHENAESPLKIDSSRQNSIVEDMEKFSEEEVNLDLKRPPYVHVGFTLELKHGNIDLTL